MADIGSAGLLIVPHFNGLTAKVNSALRGVDASKGGRAMGRSLSGGFARGAKGLLGSGALIGAFSAITGKAMATIESHVGAAAARLDTLKNYPTVMEQLGASSTEAKSSISTMSDRLQGLPTRLDDMASSVKGVWAATKDYGVSLTKATAAGLGLNDMLLAGGAGTQVATAAGEQFRQMLSKGKPDMQDWKSLVSAAPGQMDQLAKSMLGPTATANDLYAALGGGKNKATLSMSDLLDGIIALDQKGGAGLASFRSQAESATGGVRTAMENASNAVTRGIAGVMDAIGQRSIAGALDDVKAGISSVSSDAAAEAGKVAPVLAQVWDDAKSAASVAYGDLKRAAGVVSEMLPPFDQVRSVVRGLAGDVRPLVPAFLGVAAAVKGVGAARSVLGTVSAGMGRLGGAAESASGILLNMAERTGGRLQNGLLGAATAADGLAGVLSGPWGIAIAAGAVGVSLLVGHILEAKQRQDEWNSSMERVSDVTAEAEGLSSYSQLLSDAGDRAKFSAMSVDELRDSIDRHEQTIKSSLDSAQTQIATLSTAQSIIDQYAGVTDLSSAAQGKLEWAIKQVNDQLGLNISAQDVAANKYEDQDGKVRSLRDSIDQLIAKKKEEARVDALSASLTEAYQAKSEAARTLTDAQDKYDAELEKNTKDLQKYYEAHGHSAKEAEKLAKKEAEVGNSTAENLEKAKKAYKETSDQAKSFEDQLGDTEAAAEGANGAYSAIGAGMDLVSARLEKGGNTITGFQKSLSDLGADTGDLGRLSEEQLAGIADAYDGTAGSIVDALETAGVHLDAAKVRSIEAYEGVSKALEGFGDVGKGAAKNLGMSMGDLTSALSDAGIGAEQLNAIGSDNFASLVANCGGDVNRLIGMIETYNSEPIIDKDGNVTVDDTKLADAQGNVYTWNGTQLLDKNNQAVTDDVSLVDAQGHVVEWNGTGLVSKSATAQAGGNATDGSAESAIERTKTAIDQIYSKRVTISADGNVVDGSAGGYVSRMKSLVDALYSKSISVETYHREVYTTQHDPNARGGVRRHASGAVFTRPTMIDARNMIGEAGAEWYDGTNIVPLTSMYADPFAHRIADSTVRLMRGGAGNVDVVSEIRALRSDMRGLRVYIDKRKLVGAIGRDVDRELGSISRLSGSLA